MNLLASKLELLLSRNSPLLLDRQVKLTDAADELFGYSYSQLRKWIRGEVVPNISALATLIDNIRKNFGLELTLELFDDSVCFQTFCATLGLSHTDITTSPIQMKNLPFAFRPFYMAEEDATQLARQIGGFYLLFRRELSTLSAGVAAQGCLFVIDVNHAHETNLHYIRSILFIPSFRGSGTFQYEGCVCELDSQLYWIFNESTPVFPDFVFLLSDKGRYSIDDSRNISGLCCTFSQDDPACPVGVSVLLKRQEPTVDSSSIADLAASNCRLFGTWDDVPDNVVPHIRS